MSEQAQGTVTIDTVEGTRSRGETKSRKALSKLGLQKVEGINRVVMRRPKGQLVIIAQPEVFKSPISDSYIVFGESVTENNAQNQFAMAQQQMMQAEAMAQAHKAQESGEQVEGNGKAAVKQSDELELEDGAEEGLDAGDIDVIMQQANCSRAKAAQALKNTKGDLVQAILDAQA